MQCQIMLPNSMQCRNDAFASFKGSELCLTHFNYKMGELTKSEQKVSDEDVKLLTGKEEDGLLLNRIVVFTNDAIDHVIATKDKD